MNLQTSFEPSWPIKRTELLTRAYKADWPKPSCICEKIGVVIFTCLTIGHGQGNNWYNEENTINWHSGIRRLCRMYVFMAFFGRTFLR
jgi:hypothetical protein